MLDGRHHLDRALALAGRFPSEHAIKVHRRQCSCLRKKLAETLTYVESVRVLSKVQYVEVLKELHHVVQKVIAFVIDCCYERDDDFVLAAISVTAHTDRFFHYLVELDFCNFLVVCLREAESNGNRRVYSQTLQEFDWEQKLSSCRREYASEIAADEEELKTLLEWWIEQPGEHQAICWALLHRFDPNAVEYNIPLPGDLEAPPITTFGRVIGSGGCGTVYETTWKEKLFAVKFVNLGNVDDEVKIQKSCCHRHVVSLILAHREDHGKHYLMMERLPEGNLQSYILKRKEQGTFPFPILEVVDVISQICDAMLYLNGPEKKVSHRDLKPGNVLVKELSRAIDQLEIQALEFEVPALELQVTDFGEAKVRNEFLASSSENTPNRGTSLFRAPEMSGKSGEMIRGSSMKGDMHSFAMTCSFVLTGMNPFTDYQTLQSKVEAVKRGVRPELPANCPPALCTLLKRCWHSDPSKRPASFREILEQLRDLKANLLTSAVDRSVTFNVGDRRLNVLVLGDDLGLVRALVRSVCGDGMPHTPVEGHEALTESRNSWPPMCLYSETSKMSFKAIKLFVKDRNRRWHRSKLEDSWLDAGHHRCSSGHRPPGHSTNSSRLHMVWYVCGELANRFEWSKITKELCDLPVQILVTEPERNQDLAFKFGTVWALREGLFPKAQNLEELIVEVALTDGDLKENLWRACWTAKFRGEIENVAKLIVEIRRKLGSGGVSIPIGVGGARIPKEASLSRSAMFVLEYLYTYWDISQVAIQAVLQRLRSKPGEFVRFSLVAAGLILFNARDDDLNPKYVCNWDVASELSLGQVLQRESQDCYDSYFSSSTDLSCYNTRDVRAFLQSIFERKNWRPSPAVSFGRSASFSSRIRKLLYPGRNGIRCP